MRKMTLITLVGVWLALSAGCQAAPTSQRSAHRHEQMMRVISTHRRWDSRRADYWKESGDRLGRLLAGNPDSAKRYARQMLEMDMPQARKAP